jgi:hypothetical protein
MDTDPFVFIRGFQSDNSNIAAARLRERAIRMATTDRPFHRWTSTRALFPLRFFPLCLNPVSFTGFALIAHEGLM